MGRGAVPEAGPIALGTTEAQPWHGRGVTAPTVTPSEPGAWGYSVNVCRIEGVAVSVYVCVCGGSFTSHRDGREWLPWEPGLGDSLSSREGTWLLPEGHL